MGLDRGWQAVPEGWEPFEAAKSDCDRCHFMIFMSSYLQGHCVSNVQNMAETAFCEALAQLVTEKPGIETRSFYDRTRRWDAVQWLISAARRSLPRGRNVGFDKRDFGARAMAGTHRFACEKQHLGYSSSLEVLELAIFLDGLDSEDLHSYYDPNAMDGNVYKFWKDRADEGEWKVILQCFDGIRAVYASAAQNEEAMIAYMV